MSRSSIQFTFLILIAVESASNASSVLVRVRTRRKADEVAFVYGIEAHPGRALADLSSSAAIANVRCFHPPCLCSPAGLLAADSSSWTPRPADPRSWFEVRFVILPLHTSTPGALCAYAVDAVRTCPTLIWWRGAVNCFPFFLALRLSRRGQRLGHASRSAPPGACFADPVPLSRPLAPRLRPGRPSFVAASSLLCRIQTSRVVHQRYAPPLPATDASTPTGLWPIRDLRFRTRSVRTCQGLRPRMSTAARNDRPPSFAFRQVNNVGTLLIRFRVSMAGLYLSPTDASPTSSRTPAHGSGAT